jgi:dolichyl-phosphate-mannose--protein O-mannosyl transferase
VRLNRWSLPAILFVGLVLRLAYLHAQGFPNDIAAFQAWAIDLVKDGPPQFYAKAGFLDYPPGYFYILGIVGWIWANLFGVAHDPSYGILAMLVKLPGIFFDLGLGALVYAIVKRFTSERVALGAAALYVINPAIIFVSAIWGQVDSVACFFALLAVYALLRSDDFETPTPATLWIVGGWLSFAYSLIIKPQATVLLPLLLAFAFASRARSALRLRATACGIVAAIALTVVLAEPFHLSNPIAAIAWVIERLSYGTNVYPYNSLNAFTIWVLRVPWKFGSGLFWQPDSQMIGPLSQGAWGIILVLLSLALVVWRYLQVKTPQALLEGSAIALLGFFVLSTRMHERYVFDAVVFTIACLPLAKRYLWCALLLSVVFWLNLLYSYDYIALMTSHAPSNVNASAMWGWWSSLLALVNVVTFFYLGYVYLGSSVDDPAAVPRSAPSLAGAAAFFGRVRNWFDPHEGLVAFRKPVDHIVMWSLGVASFLLSLCVPKWYWKPTDKIFDEVYFARAAEEYLKNWRIYENTHPPLTKLLVTFSTMLFGGMPKGGGLGGWTFLNAIIGHFPNGDNSAGWRFLNVVFGALVVMLLFAFAKRVTRSTVWAALAALFLIVDGMHYVQSRIATPEGFVVFFSLAAVYAFYRFWIASQAEERRHVVAPRWAFAAGVGGSILCGVLAMLLFDAFQHYVIGWPWFVGWMTEGQTSGPGALEICTFYFACGFYLLFRYAVLPRYFADGARELTFPEGSYALQTAAGAQMHTVDGGIVGKGKAKRGALTQVKGGGLVYDDDDVEITYERDRVRYETAVGAATYADAVTDVGYCTEDGRNAKLWLLLFTVALGALVSSKWYGVMGFGVSFFLLIVIALQRKFAWPALWGNPRAFRLDGALVTIAFVAMTVYGLVWIPDMSRNAHMPYSAAPDVNEIHSVNDVVGRQYSMFDYHDHLKAKHPYSSLWYQWPFDYVPVAYFYQDHRAQDCAQPNPDKACCINEITSMPNPFTLWFGLLCVPLVGFFAWRERNKAYALLVVTYLFQWLPWAKSPRLAWEYHFYDNIPLICLCNAIVLQRLWCWASAHRGGETESERKNAALVRVAGQAAVVGIACLIVAAFVFFFPILSAWPLTYDAWHARMWFPTWIIGPYG